MDKWKEKQREQNVTCVNVAGSYFHLLAPSMLVCRKLSSHLKISLLIFAFGLLEQTREKITTLTAL